MEVFGAIFDEGYESFGTTFDNPNFFVHESPIFPSDNIFSNDYFYTHSQECCDFTGIDNIFESTSYGLVFPDNVTEEEIQLKRKHEEEETRVFRPSGDKSEDSSPDQCPMKKLRVSRNKLKRKEEVIEGRKKNDITIGNSRQSLLSDSSSGQDDRISNDSREVIKGERLTCLNSDGKPRASRGSATDPQSLYAKRRRERISERLRILQNLVPNGTKVDISTMLEEAVHYVKFLQLQIKLLSSEDSWMYAPMANNGIEIGMFHNISRN